MEVWTESKEHYVEGHTLTGTLNFKGERIWGPNGCHSNTSKDTLAPELHALISAINPAANGVISLSNGSIQKLVANSYSIHKDILRRKLQSTPWKLHVSEDVWSSPNHKAFLEIYVRFVDGGTKEALQALLALPELPGPDGPSSHGGAEQPASSSRYVVGDRKTAVQCGRSRVADQMHDKLLMFLDKLHGVTSRQSGKLSSFCVQRSIYLAYFGQDLSISCDAMQTVPEENSIHGISMRVEPAAGEAFAGTAGTVSGKEQQQRARVTGLESTVAARVLDSAAKEKELQEKFDKFKQLEVEQVIRLEHLATVDQENRGRIDELKRQAAAAGEDVDGTGRLVQVSVQLSEKRNELIRLEAMERDKRSVVRQLEEEERRLRSMVDDFTAKVRALSAEEQAKANSAAAIEQQQRSTVEKLTNKELSLR
ncbi:hypothetical protein NHJ13051_008248 [Beauveria bassiana]